MCFQEQRLLEEPPAALHPTALRDLLRPRAHMAAACPRRGLGWQKDKRAGGGSLLVP